MMHIESADRLKKLPPYLFAKIDQMKHEVKKRGLNIIDFGIGDPDLPTPDFIVEALKEGLMQKDYHRYPPYAGTLHFRKTIAQWFLKRFQVELDPEKEVLILIGSKEGIAHLPLAMINPGEKVLYTTPGYPVYKTATEFAGGCPIAVPLKIENQFLPDLSKIKEKAKLFFLNYPNNPTSATASLSFFEELVQWAQKREVLLCHDAAYSEIYFDNAPTKSILQVKRQVKGQIKGAKDVSIEFHSLSKTFNMTGWRIGFAVGNQKLIEALGKIKTNLDSGQFSAIQYAGAIGLEKGEDFIEKQRQIFQQRRDLLIKGLQKIGLEVFPCHATFYLWAKTPKPYSSIDFTAYLLNEFGIVTTPGIGFGEEGEGFNRFSLTVSDSQIHEALTRLSKVSL